MAKCSKTIQECVRPFLRSVVSVRADETILFDAQYHERPSLARSRSSPSGLVSSPLVSSLGRSPTPHSQSHPFLPQPLRTRMRHPFLRDQPLHLHRDLCLPQHFSLRLFSPEETTHPGRRRFPALTSSIPSSPSSRLRHTRLLPRGEDHRLSRIFRRPHRSRRRLTPFQRISRSRLFSPRQLPRQISSLLRAGPFREPRLLQQRSPPS